MSTRKMSDAHESWFARLVGGRMTRGSGNQWRDQTDGKHTTMGRVFSFAWDGKSTYASSASISRAMWEKTREQAVPCRPIMPLRFYDNEKLDVGLDLVVMDAYDFAELLEAAERGSDAS